MSLAKSVLQYSCLSLQVVESNGNSINDKQSNGKEDFLRAQGLASTLDDDQFDYLFIFNGGKNYHSYVLINSSVYFED